MPRRSIRPPGTVIPYFRNASKNPFDPFVGRVNRFLYFGHAGLSTRPNFDPPPNVVTLFTGAGRVGDFGSDDSQSVIDLLTFPQIHTTLDYMRGSDPSGEPEGIRDLLFVVHGDENAPDLDLEFDETDLLGNDETGTNVENRSSLLWGLFRIQEGSVLSAPDHTEAYPDLYRNVVNTNMMGVPTRTTSRNVAETISTMYPNDVNIVVFMGCRTAGSELPAQSYWRAVQALSSQSHYSVSPVPSMPVYIPHTTQYASTNVFHPEDPNSDESRNVSGNDIHSPNALETLAAYRKGYRNWKQRNVETRGHAPKKANYCRRSTRRRNARREYFK